MIRYLGIVLICSVMGSSAFSAPNPKEKVPHPEVLQSLLWEYSEMNDFTLEGFLRTAKQLHPLTMRTRGRLMVFEFGKEPLQIRVHLTPDGSVVERRASSSEEWKRLSESQRKEIILDSDVAYEDLGIDFLRWTDVTPLGTDSIKTLAAWAYEARPNRPSNYAKAHYWISKDFLAILRVDAFNDKGQVIKRVEVNGVKRVGEVYVIEEMMISNMIPGRDLSRSRSYLEIRRATPGSGLEGWE